jgi:hypothetical protein
MKKILLLTLTLAILLVGCGEEDNPYKEFEKERLGELAAEKFEAIRTLAQAEPCTNSAEWKITEIGSVCGISHLAYHQSTDERRLRELIQDYNTLMEVYRPLIAPFIDCLPHREPIGIVCEDGGPVVDYPAFQFGMD